MNAAFQLEVLKSRHDALSRLPLIGLALSILQGILFLLSPEASHTWQGITAWQTLWITFLSPLFLSLLTGLSMNREIKAQGGGLWLRPLSWQSQAHGELLWLCLQCLFLNLAVILPTILFGLIFKIPGDIPWLRIFSLVAVLTLSSLPLLVIGQRISRKTGLVMNIIWALLGSITGIFASERFFWWLDPWAWPIRATFVLSGTAANGVALSENSPLWSISPLPVLGVAILATYCLAAFPYALPSKNLTFKAKGRKVRAWHCNGSLSAEFVKYRHTVTPWLAILIPIAVAPLALSRLKGHGAWQLWTLLVIPLGSALLPALAWNWELESWRILKTRANFPSTLYSSKLLNLWIASLISSAILFILLRFLHMPEYTTLADFILIGLSVFAFQSFHLWIAVRYSSSVTLGIGIVLSLLALILGGTGLGNQIWPYFPWIWAAVLADANGQFSIYLLLLTLLGILFTILGMKESAK